MRPIGTMTAGRSRQVDDHQPLRDLELVARLAVHHHHAVHHVRRPGRARTAACTTPARGARRSPRTTRPTCAATRRARSSWRSHARCVPEICSADVVGHARRHRGGDEAHVQLHCSPNSTGGCASSTCAPGVGERVGRAAEQPEVLRVDRARVVVEPRRDPAAPPVTSTRGSGSSTRHAIASSGTGPASTDRSRSRSPADRAIGPNTLMSVRVVPPPTWSR